MQLGILQPQDVNPGSIFAGTAGDVVMKNVDDRLIKVVVLNDVDFDFKLLLEKKTGRNDLGTWADGYIL